MKSPIRIFRNIKSKVYMELVLFYNITGDKAAQLRSLCEDMKMLCRDVMPFEFGNRLEDVIAGRACQPCGAPAFFSDEMLVFVGVENGKLFDFLDKFAKRGISPVPLKAVATGNNVKWTSAELRDELEREHRMMSGRS